MTQMGENAFIFPRCFSLVVFFASSLFFLVVSVTPENGGSF